MDSQELLAIVLAAEEEVKQEKARKEAEAIQKAKYPADYLLAARTTALLEREALDRAQEEEDEQAATMWTNFSWRVPSRGKSRDDLTTLLTLVTLKHFHIDSFATLPK